MAIDYSTWNTTISTWTDDTTTAVTYDIGYQATIAPANPWGNEDLEYQRDGQKWAYAEDNKIEVIKGSPAKARYCIFYAKRKDPVIFCRTRRELYKEVKKLLKDVDIDIRSIRIFALIGGAKSNEKVIKIKNMDEEEFSAIILGVFGIIIVVIMFLSGITIIASLIKALIWFLKL